MEYVVSIKLKPDDEVTSVVKNLLDGVSDSTGKSAAQARSFVGEFRQAFGQIGASVSGFRRELGFLRDTYQTVTSVLGVGVRDVVSTALDWDVSMENLGLSLATIISAVDTTSKGPFANFNAAQAKTTQLMKLMRDESRNTPASFENIAESFQQILPLTRKLLPDLEAVTKLAANAATWDIIGQNVPGTTARDIRQMLGGQVAITQIQNPMLKARLDDIRELLTHARALNKEGFIVQGTEELKKATVIIQDALNMPPGAGEALHDSFTSLMNYVKSTFKVLFSEGTSGVFAEVKGWLKSLVADLDANPQKYVSAARDFGEFVMKGATALYDVFRFFYDNFSTVKVVFETFVGVWAVINAMKFVGGLYAFAEAIAGGKLLDLAKALAGFKVVTGAGTAGSVVATAGGVASGWSGVMGIGTATMTVGGALSIVALAGVLLGDGKEGHGLSDEDAMKQIQGRLAPLNISAEKFMGMLPSLPQNRTPTSEEMTQSRAGGKVLEGFEVLGDLANKIQFYKNTHASFQQLFDPSAPGYKNAPQVTDRPHQAIDIRLTVNGDSNATVTSVGGGNVTVNDQRQVGKREDH